jgi:hypothetical protein
MCRRVGNTIVCDRGRQRNYNAPPCAYCGELSTRLCDHPMGTSTCDEAMCDRHTAARPGNRDYCRAHKAAYPLSL